VGTEVTRASVEDCRVVAAGDSLITADATGGLAEGVTTTTGAAGLEAAVDGAVSVFCAFAV
jgi:hypothetical protein